MTAEDLGESGAVVERLAVVTRVHPSERDRRRDPRRVRQQLANGDRVPSIGRVGHERVESILERQPAFFGEKEGLALDFGQLVQCRHQGPAQWA